MTAGRIDDPRQPELIPQPRVVGFWSPAPQSGKSTAVGAVRAAAGGLVVHDVSFAAPLRALIVRFLTDQGVPSEIIHGHMSLGHLKEVPIPGVGKSFVELAVKLGTEFGRSWVGDDVWTKAYHTRVWPMTTAGPYVRVLTDDVRFPNEAAMIRSLGGVLVGVYRPGAEVSEQRRAAEGRLSFDDMDAVVLNDTDIETFRQRVVGKVRRLGALP